MARLFPLRSETPETEDRPRVVDLEGEDADAVFGALSSTTARRIYGHLAEEPATPSDVAEAADTSIQNARYHLESLEEAGLIEVVDTWYSSRGNEMSVYAASDGPLVVAADRSRADRLREALSRYLGGLAVLAGASLFLQYGLERLVSAIDSFDPSGFGDDNAAGPEEVEDAPADGDDAAEGGDADGGTGDGDAIEEETSGDATDPGATDEEEAVGAEDVGGANESGGVDAGAEANETGGMDADANESADTNATGLGTDATETPEGTPTPTETPTEPVVTETPADQAPEAADAVLAAVPPGLVFFLGGLLVLTLVTVWWYRQPY